MNPRTLEAMRTQVTFNQFVCWPAARWKRCVPRSRSINSSV